MNIIRGVWIAAAAAMLSVNVCAEQYRMTADARERPLLDSHRYDLRPGLRIACRVKFDESPAKMGEMTIVRKGSSNSPGSFLLRVDGPKEGVKFSFFVNHDGTPEPRVSIPGPVKAGEWYDVAAGWDGTNSWIAVNGKKAATRRPGKPEPLGCAGDPTLGPMIGTVEGFSVSGPDVPLPEDTTYCAGFQISCKAKFLASPSGETTIVHKKNEYLLRYDKTGKSGAFNFFVFLNGGWEPRVAFQSDVDVGRTYSISAGWDGLKSRISVDGEAARPLKRVGRSVPSANALRIGTAGMVEVDDFCIRNDKKPVVRINDFRTRELLPRLGSSARLTATMSNIGVDVPADSTLEATVPAGSSISPASMSIARLANGSSMPLEWTIDPGTNGMVYVALKLRKGKKELYRTGKRVVFLPEKDPDFSAKAWNPPHATTRAYHIDADHGDDSRDGLTPATAWRTFANAAALTLGPGESLLLKRGCVFNEELKLGARGSAENWAEIGAYGNGMRPQIRRGRHINDRCGIVMNPSYLVVRDLIFCNAGSGFSLVCDAPGSGHVLIERCLAHHIEGMYRFNSHGIPEWRDEPGVKGPGGRSSGISVGGMCARHVVMRDCESYQCSNGFSVSGVNTFVTRMFCHDNYAHNTSPHPYNLASRSWMTDCLFDASGWHASAGTMGIMLANNCGYIIRGCHFINQPDSGSPDQGGIDFEAGGENCLVENCTFRNNAGAAIEVLGLIVPQARNVHIRRCKFDRNNNSRKNGPCEIQVWGSPDTPREIDCSNGMIEDNGYVLIPGVPFYVNESPTTNDWILARNREFDFSDDLDRAYPYIDPPSAKVCGEVWTDRSEAALSACVGGDAALAWEQVEGPAGVSFANPNAARTKASFPGVGDYRVQIKADNGTLWRTARTAVHVLPQGARTFRAWDFAKNLDMQGWRAEGTGTGYEFLPKKVSFWDTRSYPVRLACGDYLVVAVKDSAEACIVTPDEMDVGVACSKTRANTLRIKMQNRTDSKRMRVWWQLVGVSPAWNEKNSIAFDVKPQDNDDSVYEVSLPPFGSIKQLKISFSGDGEKVTGTCRIDYIWLGRLD